MKQIAKIKNKKWAKNISGKYKQKCRACTVIRGKIYFKAKNDLNR